MIRLVLFIFCVYSQALVWAEAIQLTKVRDMTFANTFAGVGAETIAPGDANSTQYSITGEANREFVILSLPSGTINMVSGANSIGTHTWTSSHTGNQFLSPTGTFTLYIGATRDAIAAGKTPGIYSGSSSVSVQWATGPPSRTTAATHSVLVITPIGITRISDLVFPAAVRSQAAQAVSSAGAGRASFEVAGTPGFAYTIILPANGTVTMTTGGGGADREVAVNNFESTPSGTGTLGGDGKQTLYVGATRAAISPTQVFAANYSGTFSVTVSY